MLCFDKKGGAGEVKILKRGMTKIVLLQYINIYVKKSIFSLNSYFYACLNYSVSNVFRINCILLFKCLKLANRSIFYLLIFSIVLIYKVHLFLF